jgi:hypothetical protein
MLAAVLAALARLLRLLTRLLLSTALLLLARLLAAALLLAALARTRSALLLLVRIPLVRVIHQHSPRGLTWLPPPQHQRPGMKKVTLQSREFAAQHAAI